MDNYIILVCLLPIVFMFHDFEEIIFIKPWLRKNKDYLYQQYPKPAKRLLPKVENLSTEAFSVAVAEEFFLLAVITFGSIYFNNYLLWLAVFIGFFIHLFIHVFQWVLLRQYIPTIVTTLFALPYCIYTLYIIATQNIFKISEIILWGTIGLLLAGGNLLFAHKLAEWFDKKQAN